MLAFLGIFAVVALVAWIAPLFFRFLFTIMFTLIFGGVGWAMLCGIVGTKAVTPGMFVLCLVVGFFCSLKMWHKQSA